MAATVSLCSVPTLQFLDNSGKPAAGGTVLTQVGGVNYPTYQDSGGTTALPNPIPLNARGEISNATGATCQLFLVTGQIYTFTVFDVNSNQIDSFGYMVANATSADIANLQSQITAFATSFTTGTLTVTGSTSLEALTVDAITADSIAAAGASSLGPLTLSGNLAMGGNSITGAANGTFSGTVTSANFVTTTPNAASFLTSGITNSGSIVNFNVNGTSAGSGITNSAGTITFANAGVYDVMFSGLFSQPSASININTNIYFGGTANTIVGPVAANGQQLSITGANGDVGAPYSMRAIVITNAANQTLTVASALAFSGTYQVTAGAYLTISQR
jgi:hypothetical protein